MCFLEESPDFARQLPNFNKTLLGSAGHVPAIVGLGVRPVKNDLVSIERHRVRASAPGQPHRW
jgi:hypothetical protein